MSNPIKILFLAANPRDRPPIRWDHEFKAIQAAIKAGKHRDLFKLDLRLAVTVNDLSDALYNCESDIVHFCGHGDRVEGLILTDPNGLSRPIPSQMLAQMFASTTHRIRLVFLNTCYSDQQVNALRGKVDIAIGTRLAVLDEVAISFAGRFYRRLADGGSVRQAFGDAGRDLKSQKQLPFATLREMRREADVSISFVQPFLPSSTPNSVEVIKAAGGDLQSKGIDPRAREIKRAQERNREQAGTAKRRADTELLRIKTTGISGSATQPFGADTSGAINQDRQPARRVPNYPSEQVFISYSHKDKRWLDELQTILKPLIRDWKVSVWSDMNIRPGARWRDEIKKALNSATIAILLVSEQFLASDFIARNELPPLLKAAANNNVTICWIAVSHCLYEWTPIVDYQAANNPAQPLNSLTRAKANQTIVNICRKILGPDPY